jgi:hypothetical protein
MALKDIEDAANFLVNTLETILKITGEVYEIIEAANEGNDKFNGDMFNLCTLAVDNGIINTASTLLAIPMTTRETKLTLGSDGTAAIEAQTFVNATTVQKSDLSSPTPAIKQVQLVAQTAGLAPDVSSFLRATTTSIMEFAKREKTEMEEL